MIIETPDYLLIFKIQASAFAAVCIMIWCAWPHVSSADLIQNYKVVCVRWHGLGHMQDFLWHCVSFASSFLVDNPRVLEGYSND